MNYDIIGDIHGHAEKLANLLRKMGYCKNQNGVWNHSERQVIFLGDFIDRGQHQLATVKIARDMNPTISRKSGIIQALSRITHSSQKTSHIRTAASEYC